MAISGYPKGSKQNPISRNTYLQMVQKFMWNGGWVYDGSLVYIDSDLHGYVQEGEKMGEKNTPYPNQVYWELKSNGMWTGGWVKFSPEDIKYVESEAFSGEDGSPVIPDFGSGSDGSGSDGSGSDGSGSDGSGSDSSGSDGSGSDGCGSDGCGSSSAGIQISAGAHATLLIDDSTNIGFNVRFTWTDGVYNSKKHESTSKVTVHLIDVNAFGADKYLEGSFVGVAVWIHPLKIQYQISYKVYDGVNSNKATAAVFGNPIIVDETGCI